MEFKVAHVMYFAGLRERAQCSAENVTSDAPTLGQLYRERSAHHGFSLASGLISVSLNGEMVSMDNGWADGDKVAFLPPVAGG